MTRDRTDLASIGSTSEGKVTNYVRIACAVILQKISGVMLSIWTFSIAMDMSSHMATSCLDIRILLFTGEAIHNFHLLAIPMFSCHTGEEIFLHVVKALNVICPRWRYVIISISTDGKCKMTGRVQDVATHIEQVAKPGFFRLWCGLHQLDIALQAFFKAIMNEDFYSLLSGLISYLQRQQNLINEMKTKAKKVADIQWESMSNVASWFRQHRLSLEGYFNEKKPPCASPTAWRVFIIFVGKVSCEASYTFRSLEGLTTLVSQQREGLLQLHATYVSWFKASGSSSEETANAIDLQMSVMSKDKKYSIKLDDVNTVLEGLGNSVITAIDDVGIEAMLPIKKT